MPKENMLETMSHITPKLHREQYKDGEKLQISDGQTFKGR